MAQPRACSGKTRKARSMPRSGPGCGGGWGIRTPEGFHPTRFPSVRHRPLGESSWDPSRTRQSRVTLAAFPPWGSWPGWRHVRSLGQSTRAEGARRTVRRRSIPPRAGSERGGVRSATRRRPSLRGGLADLRDGPPNRLEPVAHRIYICSAEGNTGKSTVALGALDTLTRRAARVGVFRPISRSTEERDYVLDLLLAHEGVVPLEYEDAIGVSYDDVHADPDAALATIVQRFKAVEDRCDAVVIIGSDFTDVGSPTELGYNARIAPNLGAPVLLVLGGRVGQGRGRSERLGHADARTADELAQLTELAVEELAREHATLLGVVVNRADPERPRGNLDG